MPNMINPQKGIDIMNNDSIINRILFAVTIFQHYLIKINNEDQGPIGRINYSLINVLDTLGRVTK
jgi:hypothetical protein